MILFPSSIFAHGDVHEQIDRITMQIQQSPTNAALFLKRGELHSIDQDWRSAAKDFNRAEKLEPSLQIVHLARGKMLLASSNFNDAKSELDKFLAQQTNSVDGFVARGRVQLRRGQGMPAAEDFARAIFLSPQPEPEFYLERAQALVAAGKENVAAAIQVLDEGVARFGILVTLDLYAVELEVELKRFDAALARLYRLSAQSSRKETWLARRGDVLMQANRPKQAKEAYRTAWDAVAKLPAHLRGTKAMKDLENDLSRKIASDDPTRSVARP